MHDIEPYFGWRDHYIATEDDRSPFYNRAHSEFHFSQKIYNYYIHPQWDDFGSNTLYIKVLYVNYDEGYVFIEALGEWNDCLYNDIMVLKRDIIEPMMEQGITKFVLLCDNVLNFHGSDDCYYEEWAEEAREEGGWVCFVNTLKHVDEEMQSTQLQHQIFFGGIFNHLNWRTKHPERLFEAIELVVLRGVNQLR